MTNNTINNVPRELLADLLGNDHDKRIMAERHLLAMLANAPSPAGVDGWDVAGDILEKLSAAQAIIDGLRGEVEVMTQNANNYSRMFEECAEERDQQAQRICELEGLLYEASGELRTDRHHGLGPRIDAALSAGKDSDQ